MKLPVPRTLQLGSRRVGQALKKRQNALADPKVGEYNPDKRFQPFPIAVTEANKVEILRKVVTPLIDIPYEEQIQKKESFCRNVLRETARELYKTGTPVRLDVTRLPCKVNPIVRAPDEAHYKWRNKDEFSIWRGHDGKTETVGFMAFPISKHGDTVCIEPTGCEVMKDECIKMTDILQEFIRKESKLGVCHSIGHEGGWRRFSIRSNLESDLMLVGVLNPRTLLVKEVIEERDNFKRFIIEQSAKMKLPLKSLYFQPCPGSMCFNKDVPYELLHGDPTLIEKINGYKFVVSPESFLTPNTKASENLHKSVLKMIDDCFPSFEETNTKPLIIDLTCNIGVMAVHLADRATRVIGIDRSEQAISDATVNAKMNAKNNCEFICSDPEIVLERMLEKHSQYKNDTLIVCNPARNGLHRNVVHALKHCKEVSKIIYVGSKPGSEPTIDNLVELCNKSNARLPPFIPVAATPVDVYPQLESCELIIALERLPD